MYIDWSDLSNRYPDVPKIVGAGEANTYAIADAEAYINARLAPKYTTPFTPCPQEVKTLCADYAYWRLAWRQKGVDIIGKSIEDRLTAILNGTMLLTTSGAAIAAGGDAAWVDTDYHTSFGPDSEVNWTVDSSWVGATQDARGWP
jgi:phage gp36-like protein